jgi:hypothetical protein
MEKSDMPSITKQYMSNGRVYLHNSQSFWDKRIKKTRNKNVIIGKLYSEPGMPILHKKYYSLADKISTIDILSVNIS